MSVLKVKMSKSTPLTQLPIADGADDVATQEINNVINEYLPQPPPTPPQQQYAQQPQYVPQPSPQQYVQNSQQSILSKLGLSDSNLKLLMICVVLFVVLSHTSVSQFLIQKLPTLANNHVLELLLRALIFAVVVVFTAKFI